jgi:hypothetical protein
VEISGDKGSNGSGPSEGEAFSPHISTNSQGSRRFPRKLGDAAYCGLVGDVVRAIEPHTEADPAAVLISLMAMFGNAVGRGPYFVVGDARHATNLFVCVIGETSSGRKGTSAEGVRRLLCEADLDWRECLASGLVSGEGVIHHVRDPRSVRRKPKKGESPDGPDGLIEDLVDAGASDKRLMAFVPEFARVLSVVARKDNTLSAVLRDFWDRGDAQTVAKNSPERATGALVSMIAHITPHELRSRLDSSEVANGFANRYLFVAARRFQSLSRGGNTPAGVLMHFAPLIQEALAQARLLYEVEMTDSAWGLWDECYESLVTRPPGLVGAVTGRASPMVRRLALIYALMDQRDAVHEEHLLAALELWRYGEESVGWVFGDRLGERTADTCLALLREAGDKGMTRTELRLELGNRITSDRITDALQLLEEARLAYYKTEPTAGRPRERWYAIEEAKG